MQTARDREIVDCVSRLGAAGAEHVMRRFGMSRSRAYARLGVLVRGGLLEQRRLLYGQPGLYVATAEGLRWCGLSRMGVHRIGVAGVVHGCELATAVVELQLALPAWRVLSEREVRMHESDHGKLLGSAVTGELPGGRRALHRPDLLLLSPAGRAVAVEVELSVKARRRLLEICRGWARARHLDGVCYLAAPAPARALRRVVGELHAAGRISVMALGDLDVLIDLERKEAADGTHAAAAAEPGP